MFVSQISENGFVSILSMCAYLCIYGPSVYMCLYAWNGSVCSMCVHVQIFTHLYIQQLTSYFYLTSFQWSIESVWTQYVSFS